MGRGYKLIEDELLNSGIDFGAAETNRGWTNLCIRSTDTETALLILKNIAKCRTGVLYC